MNAPKVPSTAVAPATALGLASSAFPKTAIFTGAPDAGLGAQDTGSGTRGSRLGAGDWEIPDSRFEKLGI